MGHTNTVTGVSCFVDAESGAPRIVTSHDKTVCVWDPSLGKQLAVLKGRIVDWRVVLRGCGVWRRAS